MLRAPHLALLAMLTLAAACGDDTESNGTGGAGGGSTTSSAVTTTATTSSTSSTSQGQGTTTGEGGGGASSADGGAGGAAGTGGGGRGGGDTGGGGTGGGDGARFAVAWSLLVGPDSVDCFFLGGETVDVYYQREGAETVVETFSCFDEAGTSSPLPAGDYEISATLLTFEGEIVLGSDPVPATLDADGADVDLEFAAPGARIAASWSIIQGDADATCDDAGASHAEVSLYDASTGLGYGASFDCPLGEGTTRYFPLGNYEVSMNLLDFDVIVASGDISSIALQEPDETFVLPEVLFDLDGG